MIADFLLFVYLSLESTTTKTTPIPIPNPERPIHHYHTTSRRRRRRRPRRRRLAWMLLGLIGDGRLYVSFSIARGTWRCACLVMIYVVVELEMLVIADFLLFVYLSLESTTTKTAPIFIPNPERPIHHDHTTSRRQRRRRRRLAWMLLGLIGDGREYVSFSIARGTWRLAFVLMMEGSCD